TPNEGRGPQVRQVSNAYRLFAPKRALALLGRWSGRPSLPDDDAAARDDRKAIEAEHVASLDLGSFASFQLGDSPLGRALAQMGKALDLRESAKRTESQSTSYSYVVM
ncbi:helix-turn-helix domain-containing protein, partial [Paracoccus angustae]